MRNAVLILAMAWVSWGLTWTGPHPGAVRLALALEAPQPPAQTQDHSGHGQTPPAPVKPADPHAGHGQTPPTPAPTLVKPAPAPSVFISADKAARIGVATSSVEIHPFRKVIRATGRVEPDERTLVTVNTKIEGWVERLYADHAGMLVTKGQPLLELYSPEVYAIQMEYLSLSKWAKSAPAGQDGAMPGAMSDDVARMLAKDSRNLMAAARQRLALLDAGADFAARLAKTGKPSRTINVLSPISGVVLQRMATLGMRVMPGEKLFDIADLSSVWIMADVYEQDLPFILLGQIARITLTGVAGPSFKAPLEHIWPIISGETRTAKLRFSAPNPKGDLRPQMYAQIEMDTDLTPRLAVPESAVIDTGLRQIVYQDAGQGNYVMRDVEAGVRADGWVEIKHGLSKGDTVVSSAAFLIDAETRLKGSGGATGHQH